MHTDLHRREDGQTMAEYAVVLGIISVAIIMTISALSAQINAVLQNVIGVLS